MCGFVWSVYMISASSEAGQDRKAVVVPDK